MNGRPLSVTAEGRDITLVTRGVGTLLALRGCWPVAPPLRAALAAANLRVLVRVGWFGRVELLPHPGLALRLILPRT